MILGIPYSVALMWVFFSLCCALFFVIVLITKPVTKSYNDALAELKKRLGL